MAASSTLLMDRGDIASLALLAMQSDPRSVALWHPERNSGGNPAQLQVVREHADLYEVADLFVTPHPEFDIDTTAPMRDEVIARLMVEAAFVARQAGSARILMPIHVGPDHERMGAMLQRALLAAELVDPGRLPPLLTIDLPLLELTETEIVELAGDLGAPLMHSWPCSENPDEPCGRCGPCRKWRHALAACGYEWPWSGSDVEALGTA